MSWIRPYCGNENERDEIIGRQDPRCRCGKKRITPEELEKKRQHNIEDLEKEIREINCHISPIVDEIASLEDELSELNCELHEYQNDREPLLADLACWENTTVHYERRDKAFLARQDPHQAKLPLVEVSA